MFIVSALPEVSGPISLESSLICSSDSVVMQVFKGFCLGQIKQQASQLQVPLSHTSTGCLVQAVLHVIRGGICIATRFIPADLFLWKLFLSADNPGEICIKIIFNLFQDIIQFLPTGWTITSFLDKKSYLVWKKLKHSQYSNPPSQDKI